jgi:putative ABC transport system ATP-binding protein
MDGMKYGGVLPGEPEAVLELACLKGVHKVYGRAMAGVHALHDICLNVKRGEILAICGPSGSGKTSLLNVIGMLEMASEGSVVLNKLLVSKLTDQARMDLRGQFLGQVFQCFTLVPVMTAVENVMLPLVLREPLDKAGEQAAQGRALELLGQLGLSTQARHYPAKLDASQCQRIAIARALMTRPRLVLADEPTSRLDCGAVRLVMDLFARHQEDFGTAFVLTTRDQRQLSRVTRTLQLSEGRLGVAPDAFRKPLRVLL